MSDNAIWIGTHELAANDASSGARAANAATIQSASDYACNNKRQVVRLPAVDFYSDPFYLDAPGNLRSNLTNPTIFNFSLHLKGVGGLGNHEGHGTQIRFADNTQPALVVGTGQGMCVSDLSILGPPGASSRAALPDGGIGIALAGGPGGLSRCLIENVAVENFRGGVTSGFNANQLCDSVKLHNVQVRNCYRGWHLKQTQNYINSVTDCDFADNTFGIYSPLGKAVNVRGGNCSATNARRKAFAITDVSALAQFTDSAFGNSFSNWSFTADLTSPDAAMADGAYDAFVIRTSEFGLVALSLIDYNPLTGVATLKFYPGWLASHYMPSDINMKTGTGIEAELQAATTLYACETVTPFYGTGIKVDGMHVENPGVLTRLFSSETGFAGDQNAKLGVYCNYDTTHSSYANGSADDKALFYCQQAFPFIRLAQGGAALDGSTISNAATADGINIEMWSNSDYALSSTKSRIVRPNIVTPFVQRLNAFESMWPSMGRGAGEWDSTPFLPTGSGTPHYAAGRVNHAPFQGFAPARHAMPKLYASQLAAIQAGPGALGSYPCLHGETMYLVIDEATGAAPPKFARSAHQLWSYGQDLAINWGYRGQSNIVYMDDLTRMFAGLKIILDNGIDGDQVYFVTGVYPQMGYVTVVHRDAPYSLLKGDKSTTYSGSVVKQEPYTITTIG